MTPPYMFSAMVGDAGEMNPAGDMPSAMVGDVNFPFRLENRPKMPALLVLECSLLVSLALSEDADSCTDAASICDCGNSPHLPLEFIPDQHQCSGWDPGSAS